MPARLYLATILVLAVALAGCDSDAGSTPDPGIQRDRSPGLQLTGGRSTLQLGEELRGLLKKGGVKVVPGGATNARGDRYALPITAGRIDPQQVTGTIDHRGGIRFVSGGQQLTLRDMRIDLGRKVATAALGRGPIPVLRLNLQEVQRSRKGSTIVLSGIRASLTKRAAKRIENRFNIDPPLGIDPVEKGVPVGTLRIRGMTR